MSTSHQQERGQKRQKQTGYRGSSNYTDRFASKEHRKIYQDNYATCAIVVERKIEKNHVAPELWNLLAARGWNFMKTVDLRGVNETLAREFCANLNNADLDEDFVYVRGVEVPLNPEVINLALELPPSLPIDYLEVLREKQQAGIDWLQEVKDIVAPNAQWKMGEHNTKLGFRLGDCVHEDWKVLFRFINNRLYPKEANSHLRADEFGLCYALLNNTPVDLGKLYYRIFTEHVSNRSRVVCLPELITKLCRQVEVTEYPHDVRPVKPLFTKRLTKVTEAAVVPPPRQGVPRPQPHPQNPGQMPMSSRDILRLHDNQRRFAQRNHDRMEDLMHVLHCQSMGESVEDPQIYVRDTTRYSFPEDLEEQMAHIRLEEGDE